MEFDFAEVLLQVMERNASDLHLTAGSPPMIRQHGKLHALDYPKLIPQTTREVIYSILSNDQRQKLETDWQIDLAYSIPGKARFRVNAYMQRAALSAAFRLIPHEMPKLGSLGLPPVLEDFTKKPRGFVLVTGPTGSGKSTSLAAMLDLINKTRHEHIMTIEDPIEFLHRHQNCIVNQPEQQHQVRTQLSVALQGIVTQQLLPTADGSRRVVACEVMVPTPAIRNLIREGKTHQIYSALQTSGAIGMQTMDAHLAQLVRMGKISA